ncbi:hypothetical protein BDN72DRAFT_844495 [Pluteus cervinus]|uniref:Uncharacterized protein n=1 Tax=Pluteus cervinus TaxID=181527 RepID=A0ACD3AL60_9AGAR|nr:hypothetical protein BDN72DRAFT_844495 [Pluteus cervinus]
MEDEKLESPGLQAPLHNSSAPRDREPDELANLRKWQEQRLERKLRGEYESAVLHLSELINDNLKSPMRISSVRVEGAKNTRQSFLGFLINPFLANEDASDLESLLRTTRYISHRLQETDIFQHVEAKIERARDVLADANDVDIVFKTRERGRLFLNTSTELGNNEGSASATGRIRNVFGGAETFEANVSFGTKTRRSYRASLGAPLTPDLGTYGELIAYGLDRDNSSWASSTEGLRGIKALARTGTLKTGLHEVSYEAVLRHIRDIKPTASVSIREAAGQSVKSAISHSYSIDTRDDRIASTQGFYAKFFHEFAGLGGDTSFYKTEAEGQVSRPVSENVSFSLAARVGLLHGVGKSPLFPDRFQLGGPLSVRGFKNNALGPRDGPDSLGGDLYWSAGVSIISNIPRRAHWPIKFHGWVNAGRLDAMNKNLSLQDNIRDTVSKPSISAGVGLIYRFDPIRMEVNFGVPLVASKSDGTRKGIQVGVGLEFL